MRLYHGSNIEIFGIDLQKGRPGKDFGKGFYLSDTKEQAWKMAETVAKRNGGVPKVSVFECDDNLLQDASLNVLCFDGYSYDWLDFILTNRSNRSGSQVHSYDIVYGPIANDVVGVSIALYIDEYITRSELLRRLKFRHPTCQYFFGTEKAISKLTKCHE